MNAGSLQPEVPVESLKTNHLSRPRNKLLAETFYYASYIEAWGHGTLKIMEKCAGQGLPEPDFMEENGVMTVVFYKDQWNEENLKKLGYRNRRVGEFLKELDMTEGRGTGIPKVLREIKKNESPLPVFHTDKDRSFIIVKIPIHLFTPIYNLL